MRSWTSRGAFWREAGSEKRAERGGERAASAVGHEAGRRRGARRRLSRSESPTSSSSSLRKRNRHAVEPINGYASAYSHFQLSLDATGKVLLVASSATTSSTRIGIRVGGTACDVASVWPLPVFRHKPHHDQHTAFTVAPRPALLASRFSLPAKSAPQRPIPPTRPSGHAPRPLCPLLASRFPLKSAPQRPRPPTRSAGHAPRPLARFSLLASR